MNRALFWLILIGLHTSVVCAAPPGVPAGNAGGGGAALPHAGTTVQLPTFRMFGVGTTVSVPDRGAAVLGGVGRSMTARNSAGAPLLPATARGMTSSTSSGSIQITAWIHDLEAMDRALLEQAAARRAGLPIDPAQQAILGRQPAEIAAPHGSVAAIEARHAAADSAELQQARAHYAKALALEAEGKPGVARIYYRMARKHADADLQTAIAARLNELDGPQVAGD